ncbi:hypothetical protein [Aureimonas pseudogalii]|uniref:Type II secretion system protein GspC N-terminal domain-containing protein n=1 Tax=Aureimonas pseudogalii TaxID=1744844 RepID=A0A7W6EA21_9HYPH|nr:hypothetical protein [Aureimonas pseudogalii]MBB3997044.1 hypothetical protein [Aureimonas pseudogalii]
MTVRRTLRPSERWSALVCLCSTALVALAVGEPLMIDGAGGPVSVPLARIVPEAAGGGSFLSGPVFDPLRRPVDAATGLFAEPGPIDPAAASPPPLRLAGIVVEGAAPKATFAGVDSWLEVGSTIDGWTLAAVEPRRVILHRGEDTKVLDFTDAFR